MDDEREALLKIDSLEVLDYIRQSVEIIMNMKGEEYEVWKTANERLQALNQKEQKESSPPRTGAKYDNRGKVHSRKGSSVVEEGRNVGKFVLMSETEENETISNVS